MTNITARDRTLIAVTQLVIAARQELANNNRANATELALTTLKLHHICNQYNITTNDIDTLIEQRH